MSWIRVNRNKPCPICGHTNWCSVAADGSVACCQRVPSDWECKGGSGGYIHKLNPDLKQRVRNVFKRPPKKKTLPPKYWAAKFEQSMEGVGNLRRCELSGELGVSVDALDNLQCGWNSQKQAWTFPMYDGRGRMIGMRLRNAGGDKWCLTDSRNGIFHPLDVYATDNKLLFICEGPTDCAALLDLKFDVIGRPNALGGVKYLTDFLRVCRREVVIMADNDVNHGVGIQGAVRLAKEIHTLCISVSVLQPPGGLKDVRAWYNEGGTHEDIERLIQDA